MMNQLDRFLDWSADHVGHLLLGSLVLILVWGMFA